MVKKITATACFLVLSLLSTATLINATMDPPELNAPNRSRPQLPQHVHNDQSDAVFGVEKDTTAAPSGTGNGKCVTQEFCKKKKIICSKECNSRVAVNGEEVDGKHFPGKCKIKCKKCIPTC